MLFNCCKKEVKSPPPHQPTYICKNWEGIWWSIEGDSIFKDSLVIKFDKQIRDTTFYISNIQYLNSILKHKCPFESKDDNLILEKDNKKFIFRINH